jgi:amidohydrolase
MTTLSARQVDVFDVPNVVTIAMVQAGVRGNILPGDATLQGTIRTFSEQRMQRLRELIDTSVDGLAKSYGATAQVSYKQQAYVTGSDPKILDAILPALQEAAGAAGVDTRAPLRAAAEDFSFFEREIPGVYYIIGSTRDFKDKAATPSNHSPKFDIDEHVLAIGVKAQVLTALQFLRAKP